MAKTANLIGAWELQFDIWDFSEIDFKETKYEFSS